MTRRIPARFVAVLTLIFAAQSAWSAEPPPPPAPVTLSSFLGIQQLVDKCKEHKVVHKEKKAEKTALQGPHPCLTHLPCVGPLCGHLCQCPKCQLKKPPVKPLADPENLQSQNPAIKAAAEIKTEEDLAPQKIKALRYLATIGCGCYPQVKPALLAALDDCTEQVRVEAALALLRVAGNPCAICNSSTCCDPEVREKLRDKAHGMDAQGCWKEPSASVRSAAAAALRACEMIARPEESPAPEERRELPTPDAPETPAPQAAPGAPSAAGRPIGLNATAVAYPGDGDAVQKPQGPGDDKDGKPQEPAPAEAVPEAAPEAGPTELAGAYGAAPGPESAAPYMIGDFFGGGTQLGGTALDGDTFSAGASGGDRRFKIVENNSPLPTDRVFFNYHFFANPLVNVAGRSVDLHRYTFGLEKTFLDGQCSAELRVPFSSGYNSDQSLEDGASLSGTEFGDLSLAFKGVLLRLECLLVSAGLGVTFPTGSDWRLLDPDGQPRLVLENEAVHLQPFLGAWLQPNDRLFVLFFTQADFDTSGNTVRGIDSYPGPASREAGVLQDQALLFADIAAGYWIYRDSSRHVLTGIAPVIELHYSTTMQQADAVVDQVSGLTLGADPAQGVGFGYRDFLNLTGGVHFELGALSRLTVAGVVPLRSAGDRDYDAELALQFNRRF